MGNYRFRLSDMIPNSWFYKLRDMGRGRNKQTDTPSNKKKKQYSSSTSTTQCNPRKSYYFTRELHPKNSPESLTKPSKHRTRRRRGIVAAAATTTTTTTAARTSSTSVSAGCSCRTTLKSVCTKEELSSSPFDSSTESETESPDPEFRTDRVLIPTESSFDEMVSSCACKLPSNTTTADIVFDVDKNSLSLPRKDDKLQQGFQYHHDDNAFPELAVELPPIITKPPPNKNNQHKPIKEEKKQRMSGSVSRLLLSSHSVTSPGFKLRVNSPKIATRKVHSHGRRTVSSSSTATSGGSRRSLSDSLAIVKSSFNPQKDFRESMVEMIVENNLRASKDLEDLLACYLSLNSDEYHDLIIKVFKQIWFDLTQAN